MYFCQLLEIKKKAHKNVRIHQIQLYNNFSIQDDIHPKFVIVIKPRKSIINH